MQKIAKSYIEKLLKQQKYHIVLIANSIKRTFQILVNDSERPIEKRTNGIIPFISSHSPNNSNIFLIIRQTFENFHHSRKVSNVFGSKNINKLYAPDTKSSTAIMQVEIYVSKTSFR